VGGRRSACKVGRVRFSWGGACKPVVVDPTRRASVSSGPIREVPIITGRRVTSHDWRARLSQAHTSDTLFTYPVRLMPVPIGRYNCPGADDSVAEARGRSFRSERSVPHSEVRKLKEVWKLKQASHCDEQNELALTRLQRRSSE